MTATTSDGGLVATKIMYAGLEFIAPLFLIFIQNYCEIKLPRGLEPYWLQPFVILTELQNHHK